MTVRRLTGFVTSWLFAPYTGSADLDLFKRLRSCGLDFHVVQARRTNPDPRVLETPCPATFVRTELDVRDGPRTRRARDAFLEGALAAFDRLEATPDFLLSHSNEVPSHAAAARIKEQRPDLPWVAYFGDVVSANPYVRHMSEYPLFEEDCRTERITLERADVIICNNDVQRDLFAERWPAAAKRLVTVPHCFVADWYPAQRPRTSGPFTFMHLGALYSVKRRARPVLEAVDLLLRAYPAYRSRFRVVFVGDDVPHLDLECWRGMDHRDHVEFRAGVPYLDSLALMGSADVLLVIDGVFSELDRSPYLPGKLADAIGSGRPLLACTMTRGPTADVLRRRNEPVANDDPERIAFVMRRHLDGRVRTNHQFDPTFRHEVVGASMESCIRAAVAGPVAIAQLLTAAPALP